MSGVINTGLHPKALVPGVKAWWGLAYSDHEEEFSKIFDKDTSDKAYEEFVQSSGFGLAPQKGQGSAISYDSHIQGPVTRATAVAYALGYQVTYEELQDNQYEVLNKSRATSLARSMRQTKEWVGANILNRATNSSYTYGDGKELIATDHPNTTGGTWSNELATAATLSEAAMEDMITQIMGATDDRGNFINLMPQAIIVPRQEWFNANRILKTVQQPGGVNNDINVLKATNALPGGIIMNHYLTDANQWFMKTNASDGMKYIEREGISFSQDDDFDTKNAKWAAYERYSFTVVDPRAIFGTNPA